jgi:hypothetical protein
MQSADSLTHFPEPKNDPLETMLMAPLFSIDNGSCVSTVSYRTNGQTSIPTRGISLFTTREHTDSGAQ